MVALLNISLSLPGRGGRRGGKFEVPSCGQRRRRLKMACQHFLALQRQSAEYSRFMGRRRVPPQRAFQRQSRGLYSQPRIESNLIFRTFFAYAQNRVILLWSVPLTFKLASAALGALLLAWRQCLQHPNVRERRHLLTLPISCLLIE